MDENNEQFKYVSRIRSVDGSRELVDVDMTLECIV